VLILKDLGKESGEWRVTRAENVVDDLPSAGRHAAVFAKSVQAIEKQDDALRSFAQACKRAAS
jgi:hypothetical protein